MQFPLIFVEASEFQRKEVIQALEIFEPWPVSCSASELFKILTSSIQNTSKFTGTEHDSQEEDHRHDTQRVRGAIYLDIILLK